MANLEIKVETGDAADKLAAVAESLDKAAAAAEKAAPAFDKLDEAAKKAGDAKPIDQAVPDSIDKTGEAAKKLGEAAPGIDSAAAALNKVGETAGSLSAAAAAAEQAATSTDKIAESAAKAGQASEGLGRYAENANKSSEAAKTMENALSAGDAAFQSIGQKALQAAESVTGFGGAAGFVSKAFSTIMEVGGGLPGILAGIATAVAAIDFSKISEEALKAAMQIENLQRSLNVWSKDAHQAPEALEILDKTADRLGLNLEKLEKNFGKFAATAMSAGFSAKWAATAFDAVENAARASGTGMAGAQRVLNTLDIWMANGTMTAGMLGRSLKEVGMTLDQIDPKLKGAMRNTVVPIEGLNKLLVAMNNIKTVALVLQEETERVANSWTMMLGAFGRGQMATETASMKALADAMHYGQEALNGFAYAAGAVWGVLQDLGLYVGTALITAFTAVVDWVRNAAQQFASLGPTVQPVVDVFKDLGTIAVFVWQCVKDLASIIGNVLTLAVIGIVELFKIWVESCALAGRLLGSLIGLIAGGLVNAFNAATAALEPYIAAMKRWIDTIFPSWGKAIDEAIRRQQEFSKALNDDAAARAVAGIKANSDAMEENARQTRQATLEQEKMRKAATETEKAMAAAAAVRFSPYLDGYDGPDDRGLGKQWNQDYNSKYGSKAGGTDPLSKYDQYKYPTRDDPANNYYNKGQGSYYDMLKQMGYTDKQITTTGTGVFDKSTPREPNGASTPNTQNENVPNATGVGTDLVDALGRYAEEIGNATNAEQTWANVVQQGANKFDTGNKALMTAIVELNSGIGDMVPAIDAMGNELAALTDPIDGLAGTMGDLAGKVDAMGNDLQNLNQSVLDNTGSLIANTSETYYNTTAEEQNTAATEQNSAAQYDNSGSPSTPQDNSGYGGGGGSNIDQGGNDHPNIAKEGGWLDASSIWHGAKAFAEGGLTSGGIPVIAHPNEAIIPLKNGAVPVQLGSDLGEKIITVGTVAHEDANRMIDLLQKIANRGTDLLTAFNIVASKMEQSAARSSSGSGSSAVRAAASGGYIAAGDGGGGAYGLGEGGDSVRRGYYGTSNHGGYLRPSVLQSQLAERHLMGQDKALDNYSKYVGGAADGLENTNMLPGMNRDGVQLTVHPNEAIIPLPDGRSVPVQFTGERGGGTTNPGARGTVINHFHNNNVSVRDPRQYASKDQRLQELVDNITRATSRIGRTSQIDDPTRRITTPGVRGGLIV